MIWLTWRQFRAQALVALTALTALAVYLIVLGVQTRQGYHADVVTCAPASCASAKDHFVDTYGSQFSLLGAVLIGLPGLIGVFWGAPLVAREFEEKSHRLVWNQSVTRTRWLATKLAFVALAAVIVTGLLSLLLTWSASRYDQLQGDRFGALNFASRNIVPLGYAIFAFVLGTTTGLLLRRTLPAMALTLAVFVAVQILIPTALRAHLMPPVTTVVTLDATAMTRITGFGVTPTDGRVEGYALPGTWPLTTESHLFNPDGTSYTSRVAMRCMTGDRQSDDACVAAQHLHFSYTYQPASRYWPFQWIELSAFLVLTLLLTATAFWWIRTRPS